MRDARQARAKDERFHPFEALHGGVEEAQQQARVAVHRAADVTEQRQRARALLAAAARQHQYLAAVAQVATRHAAQVEQWTAPRGLAAAQPAPWRGKGEIG